LPLVLHVTQHPVTVTPTSRRRGLPHETGFERQASNWRIALRSSLHRSRLDITRCLLLAVLVSFSVGGIQTNAWPQTLPVQKKSRSKAAAKKPEATPETQTPEQPPPQPAPAPPPPPTDPLGRTSPYGCVIGFLRAAEAKDYEKAALYLDEKRPAHETETLAIELKYLLDQGLSTGIDKLSHEPAGNTEDNLRSTRELVGTVTLPKDEDLKIYLDQVKRSNEPAIWLFSHETLNQIPAAYDGMHHTDYGERFPAWASNIHFLSVPLWRWGAILVSLLIIFALASLLSRVVLWLLKKAISHRLTVNVEESILGLKTPIFFLTMAILWVAAGGYAITALGRHYWKSAGITLVWLASGWLLIRISNILSDFFRHRLLLRGRVERATFVSLIGRLFTILVLLVLLIGLLRRAGVDVTALITGLGIGGVAIALAAQKTLADLFGGLSIIMRGAVRVGDFCQIDKISGTVEDIGVSSLTLRTLERSLVSIPNSKVAEVNLENFSFRDQYWVNQVFTLRFDTPHKVLKTVLDNIFQILKDYPEIDKTSARARLINLTPSGPQIEIFAYIRRPGMDRAAFLAAQEPLLLKILSAIEMAGASIAAPVPIVRMDAPQAIDPGATR
jgi:MscS family membrane protein